ncbi:hypothetical protein [Fusobacterium polymorphum]|uniref:Uncharacterized protein n=1 Tax=Fusobacterium nucleatum subsp. polymorphum TaxID=76857 RepID=A0A2C6BJC0_FUSNP|nr:hypothetical protein [Fusobacterium polymorphum]PHI06606.1 hypothetical protein CBG54_05945 [Fusobacterium polymorphum]
MNYIILLLLAIVISDLFYSFKNITFQITGSCYFKYKNKYYEHFFCIYKRSSRYSIFNTKNYKEELLNSIVRIEIEEELRKKYKFKYILIQDKNMEITNIKKVDRFYDF